VTCSRKTTWFTLLGIYGAAVVRTVAAMRSTLTHFVICNLYLSGTSVRLALKFVTQKYWGFMEIIYLYFWGFFFTLKMEEASSFETWVAICANAHRRNAEDGNISL